MFLVQQYLESCMRGSDTRLLIVEGEVWRGVENQFTSVLLKYCQI